MEDRPANCLSESDEASSESLARREALLPAVLCVEGQSKMTCSETAAESVAQDVSRLARGGKLVPLFLLEFLLCVGDAIFIFDRPSAVCTSYRRRFGTTRCPIVARRGTYDEAARHLARRSNGVEGRRLKLPWAPFHAAQNKLKEMLGSI